MPHEKLSDFASDFGLFRLHATLTELKCDGSTRDRLIAWYWRASKLWSADSQAEFDAIAESELSEQVRPRGFATGTSEASRGWWVINNAPDSRPRQHQPSWVPCKHWAGSKADCPQCRSQSLPGAMAQAQVMFDMHRKFVIGRIHAETEPYRGHFDDTLKDDIENEVWQTVAVKIGGYRDFGHGPLAWLRTIVELTVKSHFRRTWAKKRGDAVTHELDEDNSRRVASPDDPPPVRPVRPAGAGPDDDREPSYERLETVGRQMARK